MYHGGVKALSLLDHMQSFQQSFIATTFRNMFLQNNNSVYSDFVLLGLFLPFLYVVSKPFISLFAHNSNPFLLKQNDVQYIFENFLLDLGFDRFVILFYILVGAISITLFTYIGLKHLQTKRFRRTGHIRQPEQVYFTNILFAFLPMLSMMCLGLISVPLSIHAPLENGVYCLNYFPEKCIIFGSSQFIAGDLYDDSTPLLIFNLVVSVFASAFVLFFTINFFYLYTKILVKDFYTHYSTLMVLCFLQAMIVLDNIFFSFFEFNCLIKVIACLFVSFSVNWTRPFRKPRCNSIVFGLFSSATFLSIVQFSICILERKDLFTNIASFINVRESINLIVVDMLEVPLTQIFDNFSNYSNYPILMKIIFFFVESSFLQFVCALIFITVFILFYMYMNLSQHHAVERLSMNILARQNIDIIKQEAKKRFEIQSLSTQAEGANEETSSSSLSSLEERPLFLNHGTISDFTDPRETNSTFPTSPTNISASILPWKVAFEESDSLVCNNEILKDIKQMFYPYLQNKIQHSPKKKLYSYFFPIQPSLAEQGQILVFSLFQYLTNQFQLLQRLQCADIPLSQFANLFSVTMNSEEAPDSEDLEANITMFTAGNQNPESSAENELNTSEETTVSKHAPDLKISCLFQNNWNNNVFSQTIDFPQNEFITEKGHIQHLCGKNALIYALNISTGLLFSKTINRWSDISLHVRAAFFSSYLPGNAVFSDFVEFVFLEIYKGIDVMYEVQSIFRDDLKIDNRPEKETKEFQKSIKDRTKRKFLRLVALRDIRSLISLQHFSRLADFEYFFDWLSHHITSIPEQLEPMHIQDPRARFSYVSFASSGSNPLQTDMSTLRTSYRNSSHTTDRSKPRKSFPLKDLKNNFSYFNEDSVDSDSSEDSEAELLASKPTKQTEINQTINFSNLFNEQIFQNDDFLKKFSPRNELLAPKNLSIQQLTWTDVIDFTASTFAVRFSNKAILMAWYRAVLKRFSPAHIETLKMCLRLHQALGGASSWNHRTPEKAKFNFFDFLDNLNSSEKIEIIFNILFVILGKQVFQTGFFDLPLETTVLREHLFIASIIVRETFALLSKDNLRINNLFSQLKTLQSVCEKSWKIFNKSERALNYQSEITLLKNIFSATLPIFPQPKYFGTDFSLDYYHVLVHKVPKQFFSHVLSPKSWELSENLFIKNQSSSFSQMDLMIQNNNSHDFSQLFQNEHNSLFIFQLSYLENEFVKAVKRPKRIFLILRTLIILSVIVYIVYFFAYIPFASQRKREKLLDLFEKQNELSEKIVDLFSNIVQFILVRLNLMTGNVKEIESKFLLNILEYQTNFESTFNTESYFFEQCTSENYNSVGHQFTLDSTLAGINQENSYHLFYQYKEKLLKVFVETPQLSSLRDLRFLTTDIIGILDHSILRTTASLELENRNVRYFNWSVAFLPILLTILIILAFANYQSKTRLIVMMQLIQYIPKEIFKKALEGWESRFFGAIRIFDDLTNIMKKRFEETIEETVLTTEHLDRRPTYVRSSRFQASKQNILSGTQKNYKQNYTDEDSESSETSSHHSLFESSKSMNSSTAPFEKNSLSANLNNEPLFLSNSQTQQCPVIQKKSFSLDMIPKSNSVSSYHPKIHRGSSLNHIHDDKRLPARSYTRTSNFYYKLKKFHKKWRPKSIFVLLIFLFFVSLISGILLYQTVFFFWELEKNKASQMETIWRTIDSFSSFLLSLRSLILYPLFLVLFGEPKYIDVYKEARKLGWYWTAVDQSSNTILHSLHNVIQIEDTVELLDYVIQIGCDIHNISTPLDFSVTEDEYYSILNFSDEDITALDPDSFFVRFYQVAESQYSDTEIENYPNTLKQIYTLQFILNQFKNLMPVVITNIQDILKILTENAKMPFIQNSFQYPLWNYFLTNEIIYRNQENSHIGIFSEQKNLFATSKPIESAQIQHLKQTRLISSGSRRFVSFAHVQGLIPNPEDVVFSQDVSYFQEIEKEKSSFEFSMRWESMSPLQRLIWGVVYLVLNMISTFGLVFIQILYLHREKSQKPLGEKYSKTTEKEESFHEPPTSGITISKNSKNFQSSKNKNVRTPPHDGFIKYVVLIFLTCAMNAVLGTILICMFFTEKRIQKQIDAIESTLPLFDISQASENIFFDTVSFVMDREMGIFGRDAFSLTNMLSLTLAYAGTVSPKYLRDYQHSLADLGVNPSTFQFFNSTEANTINELFSMITEENIGDLTANQFMFSSNQQFDTQFQFFEQTFLSASPSAVSSQLQKDTAFLRSLKSSTAHELKPHNLFPTQYIHSFERMYAAVYHICSELVADIYISAVSSLMFGARLGRYSSTVDVYSHIDRLLRVGFTKPFFDSSTSQNFNKILGHEYLSLFIPSNSTLEFSDTESLEDDMIQEFSFFLKSMRLITSERTMDAVGGVNYFIHFLIQDISKEFGQFILDLEQTNNKFESVFITSNYLQILFALTLFLICAHILREFLWEWIISKFKLLNHFPNVYNKAFFDYTVFSQFGQFEVFSLVALFLLGLLLLCALFYTSVLIPLNLNNEVSPFEQVALQRSKALTTEIITELSALHFDKDNQEKLLSDVKQKIEMLEEMTSVLAFGYTASKFFTQNEPAFIISNTIQTPTLSKRALPYIPGLVEGMLSGFSSGHISPLKLNDINGFLFRSDTRNRLYLQDTCFLRSAASAALAESILRLENYDAETPIAPSYPLHLKSLFEDSDNLRVGFNEPTTTNDDYCAYFEDLFDFSTQGLQFEIRNFVRVAQQVASNMEVFAEFSPMMCQSSFRLYVDHAELLHSFIQVRDGISSSLEMTFAEQAQRQRLATYVIVLGVTPILLFLLLISLIQPWKKRDKLFDFIRTFLSLIGTESFQKISFFYTRIASGE
eukprot:gnl/Chilomastix_cuspidata/2836.p1 GENE.gnl/Chilomastix_cuspidata/2836~~gnl/Chilomastix_cuspidata/2836.p1  ORF type:complete len:2862 (+),score=359.83 gnl/Chilomastix_cuspidata/2836:61-8646(+)